MHIFLDIVGVDMILGGLAEDQMCDYSKAGVFKGEKTIPVLGFCDARDR